MDLKYLKHLAARGASFIHPKGYGATRLLIQKLNIKNGDKILEIGSGTGATLAEIASGFDVKIDGLDVLDEMLKAAKDRIKFTNLDGRITLFKGEMNKPFPFPDETYDKVYTESVIGFQPAESFQLMLSEIYRVLKKGGRYIANEALWKDGVSNDIIENISGISNKDFGLAQASPDNITLNIFKHFAHTIGFEVKEICLLDNAVNNTAIENNKNSNKFTRSKKNKSLFSPFHLFNEIKYYFKIKKHKGLGKYINSYLLVFVKVK